jgi:hypothetical protein
LISRACHGLRRLARNKKMPSRLRQSNPTGKSLPIVGSRVKTQNKKYFAFPEGRNSGISVAIPSRQEGRIMIVTNVGRVAVDAEAATDERG